MELRDKVLELRHLLIEECSQHGELLRACEDQNEAVLAADAQAMQKQMVVVQEILSLSKATSMRRVEQLRELSQELGIGEPHSLGRLLLMLPDEDAEQIRYHATTLQQIGSEIREMTERIQRLSKHRMDLLQGDFNQMLTILQKANGGMPDQGSEVQGTLVSTQA